MSGQLPQQIEQAPISYVTLFVYLAFGVLTNALDPQTAVLVHYGAAVPIFIQDGDWWRLITNAYLHGGLLHLGLNAYALYLLGPLLERTIGSGRFALLYVITAVAGSATAILTIDPRGYLVGGSAALFGMIGGMLALVARSGRTRIGFLRDHFARYLLGLVAANLVLGWLIPMVSNSAHVGGLISGFVLVYVFFDQGRERIDAIGRAIQGGWIAVFLALVAYTLFPVLRWDYQLERSLTAPTAEERATFERAVGHVRPEDEAFLRKELARLGPRGDALAQKLFR